MPDFADLADRLCTALALSDMPVALSLPPETPADHERPSTPVAAGCQFWERGTRRALTTIADDHRHCSIGIHTHNLGNAPRSQPKELSTTLAAMQGLDYVREDEVGAIPVLADSPSIVAYTPLAQCTGTPALVLLFANARQGLVLAEAVTRVDGDSPAALGRPACALVPAVINAGRASSSLGCCGARAYLDRLDDNTTVWAIPAGNLEAYVAAIETMSRANDTLTAFHQRRRADIAAGAEPSVEQSLARIAG